MLPPPVWLSAALATSASDRPGAARAMAAAIGSKPAQQRKRKAAAELRELAAELQVASRGRSTDLSATDFNSLLATVVEKCQTPDQRDRAQNARLLYEGRGGVEAVTLPVVPVLPPLPAAAAASSDAGPRDAQFRLRGTSCLLSYNSPTFVNADEEDLWQAFLAFVRALDFVMKWTATLEESRKSREDGRVHLHAFMEFKKAVDWSTLGLVRFRGSLPDARPTIARGDNQREVINHGHFYVFAAKPGTRRVQTSGWEPWRDYAVKGWWIDELWTSHKLDHSVYLEYAAKVRVGFVGRQRQAQALQEQERVTALRVQQQAVALKLAPLKKSFVPEVIAALAPWRQQYETDQMRYSFLVLRGVSRSGKSTLAKSLGAELDWGLPFVQTVQSATAADLKSFSHGLHGYIVFDNVNHQDFVLTQRALFQANNDLHTLADSKTGIYAYTVWLYKIPIVLTVDTSAVWDAHEPWIAANSVDIFLDRPCYTL